MDIVLCTDDNFAVGAGTCISSVLNHDGAEGCHFHIITFGLNVDNTQRFKLLAKERGCQIDIHTVDAERFEGMMATDRFPKQIYLRYLAPELINADKSLYLDCDIVACGSLKTLWNTDISGVALAAVADQRGGDLPGDREDVEAHIGPYDHTYFNSGVLLLNHKVWREMDLTPKLIQAVKEHPSFALADQDALNFLLRDKIVLLRHEFNYQTDWYYLNPTTDGITLLHFNAATPWRYGAPHQEVGLFDHVRCQSPWRDYCYAAHARVGRGGVKFLLPLWAIDRVLNRNITFRLASWIMVRYNWWRHGKRGAKERR